MYRLILFCISFSLCSCAAFIQQKGQKNYVPSLPQDKEYEHYNKYQKDFVQLVAVCEEGFPLIDQYFPEKERTRLQKETLRTLGEEGVNDKIFTLKAYSYLARFRNQHTTLKTGAVFTGRFPFTAYNHHSSWYLQNIGTAYDSTLIGRKIVSINHMPADAFAEKAGNLLSFENPVSLRKGVAEKQLLSRSEVLYLAGLIPQPDSILLEVEGHPPFWLPSITEEESITLYPQKIPPHPITTPGERMFDYQLLPEESLIYFQIRQFNDRGDVMDVMKSYIRPWLQPLVRLYLKIQFRREKPSDKLRYFYDPLRPDFSAYLSEMMEMADSLRIRHLVIDLRNNNGGNPMLGKQLMYHLTEKKDLQDFNNFFYPSEISRLFRPHQYDRFIKNYGQEYHRSPQKGTIYPMPEQEAGSFFSRITDPSSPYHIPADRKVFKGEVYVLANHSSASAAALLTALLQDNNLATVIGTSVGNNPTGPTTYTPYRLKHTRAGGSVASTFISRPDSTRPAILQPDYWLEPELTDKLKGKDPLWEKALELMGTSASSSN